MAALQPLRGTHDLLPEEEGAQRWVAETAREVASRYGYRSIATPIFEFTEVFQRTLGETSDVVSKEMYSFETKGGEAVTLRPEGTAGVARALISGGLYQQLPLKFFYAGPMFRHERPQKGRLRQFHQFGIELLGVPSPAADVEVVAVGRHILEALGVGDSVRLELNTLGDPESRQRYRAILVDYFRRHLADLSEDSRDRLERNPLRILDSKDKGDQKIVAGAPAFLDSLSQASQDFFAEVTKGLAALGIAYELNPRLVRGLDYYCHTAFEFITEDLGAQGTVLGGGRYDGLVELLGGRATPGVGFAAGIERLAMLAAPALAAPATVALVPLGAEAEATAWPLAQKLRKAGLTVDLGFSGNLGKRMKRADKLGAAVAVILGEEELARGVAAVKDLTSGAQEEVALETLESALRQRMEALPQGRR